MTHKFTITVTAAGDYSEQELRAFLMFQVGGHGGLSTDNPFNEFHEEPKAEITNIDIL